MTTPARTRVAPSPTGDPHVGTAYMALFDKAWAVRTGGQFVLRIEDTDRNRLVPGSEQQIVDSLNWLGLTPDESPEQGGPYAPYTQSQRLDTYRPVVDKLLASGHAYHCWCSQERLAAMREEKAAKKQDTRYDRLCYGMTKEERAKLPGFTETPVVRMYIPDDAPLVFHDLIRGEVKAPFPDDQVILKADGFPTYHLAVVVDDHEMKINTVVRGEEWISSTPKHLLLYKWLGWELPAFAHMPLLRNTDHSKISKRKNPAARLMWFKEQGYLPQALRNFLQLLAYPPAEGDQELESFADFVGNFAWSKVNTVGPVFDTKKLDWLNGQYIRELSDSDLADQLVDFIAASRQWGDDPDPSWAEVIRRATPIIKPRLVKLSDAWDQIAFLVEADDSVYIEDTARAQLKDNAGEVLDATAKVLATVEPFTADAIQQALRDELVDAMGIKPRQAFAPLRVATSGRKVSPPLFESCEILGRASVLARIAGLRETL
ncbi:glutamate--tRNA ligase [Propionibacterium freudenreichii]|jgi:glutamyl-tRNA synthetase|uniref:Glutamate--tRNA ligase n=3 Tax=Propionibacterium freudenreichii TaxID=1744 RepID=D7GJ25_PROFC|nr:glutamate--tRNA ligase [Propionibacterium freudenreichii]MCT2973323.1 glutamate--tRNA ligase [Propionibacterium freudenreichii]MCT2975101.1 glutamate--tRNA ligase [Propionibacterium freudenreichii]MCT2980149.1 glutamate--tRNA ligase [Propionibacterium freudenreichii]MCT2989455.1 glutamate--tRNA ligase [Propionibacterium freudenreichii]MCT2997174.1 glutamate--tRNA ligase [Propionibacterium freudenreichii]